MKLPIIGFILIMAAFGVVPMAEACVCGVAVNPPIESRRAAARRAFEAAEAVFVGEVASNDGVTATLNVTKVWKGTLEKTARLYQATRRGPDLIEISTCTLMVGKGSWLIFAG